MSQLTPERLERLNAMEGSHFWSEGRDLLTRRLLERFVADGPIVDAGAGTGSFAAALAAERRNVIWFDAGPTAPPGFVASICAIPLADASVGAVLARDVLEHVDDQTAMGEIARILRPGGHAIITVPGWPSLWSPRDDAAGHLRRYRRRDLRRLAQAHGMEVVDLRGYQFVLLPLVMASRLWSRWRRQETATEESLPPALNRLLGAVNRAEATLARGVIGPPTGSSLVMVARRQ